MRRPRHHLAAALLLCGLIAGAAGAQTLTITDTSVSVSQARDGITILLGYRVTASAATTATFAATLRGPSSVSVGDMANNGAPYTFSVAAGTNWYYRDFLINLPPSAANGTYYVNYTVTWGSTGTTSAPGARSFTMLAPVTVRCPILMYHKVGDALYSQYWNTTDMLRAQMAALKAYGYTAITMRELMNIRAGIAPAPAKPIMLTFDGGYQNFYLDALPILMEYDYRPVMFLLTGVMGMDNSWDGDNNPVIMFMTWNEVTAAYNTGYVDLESHTVTHPDLASLANQGKITQINQELTNSRNDIRSRYGCPCDFFCYPYGSGYNSTTVTKAIRSNGYFGAVMAWGGVETSSADKYALKRVPVYSDVITEYDPARASSFFFTKIGDPLVIPSITIDSVEFVDPATGSPITELHWGQMVKVRATATNSGLTADAGASLVLDNDSDTTSGVLYDSHAAIPAQDTTITGWSGQRAFEWLCRAPIDTPTGQYAATVSFRDKLYVLGFKKSVYPAFQVVSGLNQLKSVKSLADGDWITLKDVQVSAAFDEFFYVESDSRTTGVRVEMPNHGVNGLTRADVAGYLTTKPTGEQCIAATSVFPTSPGFVSPLGLSNRALASALATTGLLVRTWGRVKSMDSASRSLVIDDGSGSDLKCVWEDNGLVSPNWTYVTLTGVSSLEDTGGHTRRVLLIASAESISP